MISKQDQISYLNQELTSVRKFLTGIKTEKPGKKQIHDLRVSIKKITALIEVNKIRGYQPGILPMLGMRSVFKLSGTIRSSQLILDSLQKSGINEKQIRNYHKEAIRNALKKLQGGVKGHLKMINTFKIDMTARYLHDLKNDQVLQYLAIKSAYLGKIFKSPLDPELLHEGRKQIKHILYIHEMINLAARKHIMLNMANLDELQNLIGKWHDTVVYLDFLEAFMTGKKHDRMKAAMQKKDKQFRDIINFRLQKNKDIFKP